MFQFESSLMLVLLPVAAAAQVPIIPEHEEIVGPFETPQEVTKVCLECHAEQAEDLLHSRHWRWLGESFERDGQSMQLGKRTMLNNFCINVSSNEPRCTSCHIGFGWKDSSFDFENTENMDCLVCHDRTGTYKKFPTDAGYPVYDVEEKLFKAKDKVFPKVDLLAVARSTASPTNANCGSCHFYGGGGHNVKHGDLTKALIEPAFEFDAHMGHPDPAKRQTCVSCHKAEGKHDLRGALHSSMAAGQNHFGCVACHEGPDVHSKKMRNMLNMHTKTVSCEVCHIPAVAKQYPTKTWWDWTTAGDKSRKGEKDENGMSLYTWKKGDFLWEKNLRPEYHWYDGTTEMYLLGEEIELTNGILTFNPLNGSYGDPNARISAFKVMRGKQYYDKLTNQLLVPHLFGKGGYWKTLDWHASFTNGMNSVGLRYSGEHDVVETEMFWPVYHQVVPAEQAAGCVDCHTKDPAVQGLLDWKRLGYAGDPVKTGRSRTTDGLIDW